MPQPLSENVGLQQYVCIPFDHPQVTQDTTWKFYKVPAGKTLRVDKVEYINPTGLAEDATNVYNLILKAGSTTVANYSSDSDGAGADNSIPADEFIELAKSSTDADLIAAADSVLSLTADEGGSATLPPGRLVVHGRFV